MIWSEVSCASYFLLKPMQNLVGQIGGNHHCGVLFHKFCAFPNVFCASVNWGNSWTVIDNDGGRNYRNLGCWRRQSRVLRGLVDRVAAVQVSAASHTGEPVAGQQNQDQEVVRLESHNTHSNIVTQTINTSTVCIYCCTSRTTEGSMLHKRYSSS